LAVDKQGPPADVWISLSGTGGKPVDSMILVKPLYRLKLIYL
jgi:hypothetical protein